MAANAPLLMRIVASSVAVARRAGDVIRDVLKRGDLGIVEKGKNDLQTEADRSAQRCIVASLHRQFPKVAIYGEEQLDPAETIPDEMIEKEMDPDVLKVTCPEDLTSVQDEDVVIWVDPLDGTSEFTIGLLDHVTVLIGVAVKGKAVAGVIYQPYYNYLLGPDATLGRCIWGVVGADAFGFTKQMPPCDKNIITTTRAHSDRIVTEAVDCVEPSEVVRVGGAGHKVLLLIEGKVHAYVFASSGCKKWDTCAPEAVLHTIGGTLTDLVGNPMEYHREVQRRNAGGVLATLSNHQWYLDKIPEEIKQRFRPKPPAKPADDATSQQCTEQEQFLKK